MGVVAMTLAQGTSILVGAALGESMAAPSLLQRSALMPGWTRRLARELVTFGDEQHVTDHVSPFGLNVTPTPLVWGPGDATDWMAWRADCFRRGVDVERAWRELADSRDEVRGRISAMSALDQIAKTTAPPRGDQNPHSHDDAAALRALALSAVGCGRRHILEDAAYTASGDGLTAALLMHDAVAGLASGAVSPQNWDALRRGAGDSRLVARWCEVVAAMERTSGPWELAVELAMSADAVYSYGSMAAETVPVALGLVVAGVDRDPLEVMAASLQLHRQSATLPVLVGALLGASRRPQEWPARLVDLARTPSGCSIAATRKLDLIVLEGASNG
ncbi:ADP-ribosylglycohydrolase family protein [Propionibacteriaceae bacterium G1746]